MPRFGVSVLLFGLLALPEVRAVNLRMEAATTRIENITRASAPTDWKDANRHEALLSLGQHREWRTGLLAVGSVDFGAEDVTHFNLLTATTQGLSGTLRWKFGFGAFAPWIAADAGLRYRSSRLDFDDGWTKTVALRAGKRFTSNLRVTAVADWQQQDSSSAIFDLKHHRVFATVTWDITDRLQLSHGNGRLWGTFTANASPGVWSRALAGELGAALGAYYNTIPWAVTESYGRGWVTYRVDGHVSFWWLELSPALGRNTSLPLRYESRLAVNLVGVKYRQDLWSLALLHKF